MKSVMSLGIRGNLNPKYIGTLKILCMVGEVAYDVTLPSHSTIVHQIFYVSMF